MDNRNQLDYIKRQIAKYSYLHKITETEREKRFYSDILTTYKKQLDEYSK